MATEKRLIDANKFKHKMKLEFLDRRNKFISMKDLFECIDDMNTVDAVEVVHGRWEDMYGGKYENLRFRCSLCKKKALYVPVQGMLGNWSDTQALSKYCPNCGAKMDGGSDDA